MDSIGSQIEQMILQRAQQGQGIVNGYKSSLEAAAGQDQSSIDQLRGVYSDPSKFEKSKLGAFGLGLMAPTKTGNFGEGMFNGLAAATAAQDYNREQNLSREEKLAHLGALEAALTRQKAQDQLSVYDTQSKWMQGAQSDQSTLADLRLQGTQGPRPLMPGEQGPEAPGSDILSKSMTTYNDYLQNPQKYAGAQGQAMVKSAIDIIQNERNNQRALQVAQTRGTQKDPLDRAEANRVSGRLKGLDSSAEDARTFKGSVSALRAAREQTKNEGMWGADFAASWLAPFSSNASGMQQVRALSTDMQLGLSTKLKGAISDKEQAMLSNATPGLNMTDESAGPVLDALDAASDRAIERSKFMKKWISVNRSDYGADEAWDQYVADNPIIGSSKDGKMVVNRNNVGNWQGYVQSTADEGSGSPPLDVDSEAAQYSYKPTDVVAKDADGDAVTWDDVLTTAKENGWTLQYTMDKLQGK